MQSFRRFFLLLFLGCILAPAAQAMTPRLAVTAFEINPGWSAVGSCLLAIALILRHSAKFRK